MKNVFQFGSEITSLGLRDVFFRSGHQRTVTGEPDRIERPQAALIEGGNFIERVEGAPVGIPGTVLKLLQLAENVMSASVPNRSFNCLNVAMRFLRRNRRRTSAEKRVGRIML